MEPLRGEVWDVHVRGAGTRPFVILTVNPMIARLGAVTAVLVTGTAGLRYTHIPLGAEAGLAEYAGSYANAIDLHTIPKPRLHHRRGRLAGAELASLERAVRTYLGL
ncbi:MAG TPA: type II toxin-antitoxin system PemK/MazF family toxin [Streptosporangiaceae bacterium]